MELHARPDGFRRIVAREILEEKRPLIEAQIRELEGQEDAWFLRVVFDVFTRVLQEFPSLDCRGVQVDEDHAFYKSKAVSRASELLAKEICVRAGLSGKESVFTKPQSELSEKDFSVEETYKMDGFIAGLVSISGSLWTRLRDGIPSERIPVELGKPGTHDLVDVFTDVIKTAMTHVYGVIQIIEMKQEESGERKPIRVDILS